MKQVGTDLPLHHFLKPEDCDDSLFNATSWECCLHTNSPESKRGDWRAVRPRYLSSLGNTGS
ncbi:hypothetical protein HYDPIDRAFT_114448 [Hydnomerulius pinastri MD-312]|uniref:Uncharacterized protein n=1 Tax=Hydnomerulius pinastri MD-312 TaxID=994086 RepID=A0A0C9W676_9AGAM|nr:hypothetical protein HYDPIDRAFT_119419 [Hydnomerulius pinastri MD-312]KIJ62368.1 hypothetical protein HYDPIDRAFT_114448 [Hydnomerulius pinastri MD-312]